MKKLFLLFAFAASTILSFGAVPEDQFRFISTKDGSTIGLDSLASHQTIEYSQDATIWTNLTTEITLSLNNGDSIYVRGKLNNSNIYKTDYTKFVINGQIEAKGNINYLWDYENLNAPLKDYCGYKLFAQCDGLISSPDLPSKDLALGCYQEMFRECSNLTKVAILPATRLSESCYNWMFALCSSLEQVIELPATTLADNCYRGMFYGCAALKKAPELPATTLAENCYLNMFRRCTNLTDSPELPATTLTEHCYDLMFAGCTSLTNAPELPATTLAHSCYSFMFWNCTNLTNAPELPATILASKCYYQMFKNCPTIVTAPELPALILTDSCYFQIFKGCSLLNSVKCLAVDISADLCTYQWLQNVAETGTFVKNAEMDAWSTGYNGIPSGWAVEQAIPTSIENIYDASKSSQKVLIDGQVLIQKGDKTYTITGQEMK